MTKILIVDDEPSILRTLRFSLEPQGFHVEEAANGTEALEVAKRFRPQLIILDLGLPDLDGLEVLKAFRIWTSVPVIVLTANDDEQTKVTLLEMGADDYVTKPFSARELLARMNVALRHHRNDEADSPTFQSGELKINLLERRVEVALKIVKLTTTEFQIVAELVRARGQVVSQEHLLKSVWGVNAVQNPHYLRIYMGHIRKKLEADSSLPKHFLTEPGVGYRLV